MMDKKRKKLHYILISVAILTACSSKSEHKEIDLVRESILTEEIDSIAVNEITTENDCDFVYDTISNENYRMHLRILDKFYDKTKRGYCFSNGDTLNNFLYSQDISVFITSLDSTETGTYYLLTNMVVNLIVSEEPAMFDFGLPKGSFKYFLSHVGNQHCGSFDFNKVVIDIESKMKSPSRGRINFKEILLNKIKLEKERHVSKG